MWQPLRQLWRNIVRRRQVAREIDEEVRGAFESLVEEYEGSGLSPAEAQRAATLAFGRVETVEAQVRDVRRGAFLDTLAQDVRFGLRLLARSPLFAIFAAASLALGIGAAGAAFALFDRLVLRELPVAQPDRLVVASFGGPGGRHNYSLPYPQFEAIRARSRTLAGVFAHHPFGRVTVSLRGDSSIAEGVYVSGDYYRVLGLAPALGRLLQPADDRPGVAVAVLSHGYWQRRFGGRPDIVGTDVLLNAVPFTVVGVEPEGFTGTEVGRPHDVSVPMRAIERLSEGPPRWDKAFWTWIYVMGRLKPGVTIEQAEQETRTIFAQVGLDAAASPGQVQLARTHQLRLQPAATGTASDLRATYGRWLRLLLTVVIAVLLLASLNVATLLLSRSDARQREIATRLALGAGRARIVRQLLTESMLLAAIAAGLGLALATWGSRALLHLATPFLETPPLTLAPDGRLLAFLAALAVVTCLLFGLMPALRSTSPARLTASRQVGGGRHRRGLDRSLVMAQVALSLVLLVGAGLFLRTLGRLWAQETGYDRRDVLMFSIDAHLAGKRGDEIAETYRRVLEALEPLPGARRVSASAVRAVSHNYYFIDSIARIGDRELPDGQQVRVAYNLTAPGYFATLGIPLVAGRDFDRGDTPASAPVVIVSESLARHFTGNPIGQRIGPDTNTSEVVGVVKDIRYGSVKDAPREVMYVPLFQVPSKQLWFAPTFAIRYAGRPGDLIPAIRDAVARVDPGLELFGVRTLEAQTDASLARERLLALLTSYGGGFALVLSCLGLYGVLSDRVTLRTAEIGLRLALGAQPAAVRRLVLGEAALMVVAGALAGLGGALATARLVRSQLFGVEPDDPVALAGAVLLLVAMAALAAYLPARRASRLDPLAALRHEGG